MVNMDFGTSYAPYEGGAGNLDNTIACTNAVNTASYNFNLTPGGYIAGNPAVVEGGTDPLDIINNEGGSNPLDNINSDQCGGAKRRRRGRKSKRSKKLRRSNKSRLSTRSRKSKSKVRSKVKKLSKRSQNKSFRKSLKKKSRKSLK